jgi:ABC-type antimicrobial peptide transport system permease subunit
MIQRFHFALIYAVRNVNRNRQRALFAIVSIAAGVATVVALRILGLMLTDALTANAQAFLRSDILVAEATAPIRLGVGAQGVNQPLFSPGDTKLLVQWAKQHDIDLQFRLSGQLLQIATLPADDATSSRSALAFGYFVDPKIYPYYDVIRASSPGGATLRDLMTGDDQVVVSEQVAEQLGLQVGSLVRVGVADTPQTVVGIVPDQSENYLDNPFGIAFGFVYLDYDDLSEYGLASGSADRAYLRLPPGEDPEVVVDSVYNEWRALIPGLVDRHIRYDRIGNVLARNATIANFVSQTVLLFSLVALVIGGVGIINTMFVTISRRAREIAVLKSIGLRRADITRLFLVHAALLGLLGSLLGTALGVLFSRLATQVGEATFGVRFSWRVDAEPVLTGLLLGCTITLIFSLLPVLTAAQVQPVTLLRRLDVPLTHVRRSTALLTFLLLTVCIGTVTGLILAPVSASFSPLPPLLLGIGLTTGGFLLLGLFAALLYALVGMIARLPAGRSATLGLALRGLSQHRTRTAFTLLSLIIGMAALSGTLILSRSINVLIYSTVSEPLGGNLIVIPLLPLTQSLVHTRLDESDAVSGYRDMRVASATLIAIDGDTAYRDRMTLEDSLASRVYVDQLQTLTGVETFGSPPPERIVAGRALDASDAGRYRVVVPDNPLLRRLGIGVGSTLTYFIGGNIRDFAIVGIVEPSAQAGLLPVGVGEGAVQAPLDIVPQQMPFTLTVASVTPAAVPDVSASMRAIPGVFVLDVSAFDSIINRVLRQTAALPLLIAGLSLFAAAVLVATTVSLSTFERRRQIGILKALGLKQRQAMLQLLVENGLIGFIGGLFSLLPTLIVIQLIPVVTEEIVQLPLPLDLILAMLALSTGLTLVSTLLTGWSAVREPPIRALRYE